MKLVIELVKKIQTEIKDCVRNTWIPYFNLWELVQRKIYENPDARKLSNEKGGPVATEAELRDPLRQLEDDNYLALFGSNKDPTVRFV